MAKIIPPQAKLNPIPVARFPSKQRNWALDALLVKELQNTGIKGAGVRVAILDSGAPREQITKKHFPNIVETAHFFGNSPEDQWGHGSHVAGIIGSNDEDIGIAPHAELYIARVLGKSDNYNIDDHAVVAGIKWAMEHDVHIINMSLALSEDSPVVHAAVQEALAKNILMICGAAYDGEGGETEDYITFPSRYPECVAIAGLRKENGKYVAMASSGESTEIEVSAPGNDIYSHWISEINWEQSGTSMAAAVVTGMVALWYSDQITYPNNVAKIRRVMRDTAYDLYKDHMSMAGLDPLTGRGLINMFGQIDKQLV